MQEENSGLSSVQAANQRNIANNANNIRAAADVASKTSNPYAKAAGTAVKVADKLSGGKASENLGKKLNTLNKMSGLKGRMMQSALNKMSESGTSDRIASAMNAKKVNTPSTSPKMAGMTGAASQDTMTSVRDKNESESSDSATATFSGNFKVVKYGLIGLAAIFPIIICCLFMASSQIYGNSVSLGTADSLSGDQVEDKINKKMKESPEELDEEITDERIENETAFIYDKYITNSKTQLIKNNKLYNVNIVQTTNIFTVLKRKYNEATLDRIEEFFPAVVDESKNYDENMVYDFYFKMYNLYITYKNQYNIRLDLPLLMATLNLQSSDKNVIFSSNMDARYRTTNENDIPKNELDYYYDWSNYKINRNNSEHDMEILAQNMISKQVKEKCVDSSGKIIKGKEKILKDNQIGTQTLFCDEGEIYETEDIGFIKDDEKYREFLKQFLEKKYYLEGEHSITTENGSVSNGDSLNDSNGSESSGNLLADKMIEVANREYILTNGEKGGLRYKNAFRTSSTTPWCAIFAWYVSANTEVNGQKLYPDIITLKSASTGAYMRYFNSSEKGNINFYYNDSCKNLNGKNGNISYIPKTGDYIFFDWQERFKDISSGGQDHTAIVEKYENGFIYTIEGNMGNTVKKKKYRITSCEVIGFGSWY